MAAIQSHRDLVVWQKAMDLSIEVYTLVKRLPASENFRMIGQVTRSVISVPANIAEGHARSTRKDYANFLAIAQGSLAETETYILLAIRLGYVTARQAEVALGLVGEVGRMLTSLRQRLNPRERRDSPTITYSLTPETSPAFATLRPPTTHIAKALHEAVQQDFWRQRA